VAAGSDLFLSICGLLASGARTVLISRWRTGGQTSFDLVREFAQELPHVSPAEAWQRSVQIALDTPLDPAGEPRIRGDDHAHAIKTSHPFFWSGYLLVDSGVAAAGPEQAPLLPAADVPGNPKPPAALNPLLPAGVGQPAIDVPPDEAAPRGKAAKKAPPRPRPAAKKSPTRPPKAAPAG
jgi:hypothetical protein